jgi:hypothetical protein
MPQKFGTGQLGSRVRCGALALALAACGLQALAEEDPHQLYKQLSQLSLDPNQVYTVHELRLRREGVTLHLVGGRIAFFAPFQDHVLGAVFAGEGRVLATPREPEEKISLAHFLGVPLLDQPFTSAYLRFSDDTAGELLRQIRAGGAVAGPDPDFLAQWNSLLPALNSWHSLRVMMDLLSTAPQPYFYAGVWGENAKPFDVLVDPRREEPVLIGQPRQAEGERFYDVWASLPSGNPHDDVGRDFSPVSCAIDTSIQTDMSIRGQTTLRIRARGDGQRMLVMELVRLLQVEQISDTSGQPLAYFQNQDLREKDLAARGDDALLVVLPRPLRTGEEFELRIRYHGNVIADAGNGVYFVGAHEKWYPHLSGPDRFIPFDLTFRWPRRLTLVATGEKTDEQVEGEFRTGHWRSPASIALAGFNLGEYAVQTVSNGGIKLSIYANHELENNILARLQTRGSSAADPSVLPFTPFPGSEGRAEGIGAPPPSPAAVLKQLGASMLDSVQYFERWNGAFPFADLNVTQIPGSFGQGWPGLIYLSTLAFLPPETQQQAGISRKAQQQIEDLVPFHEAAHQWWGNVVGAAGYRDTWLLEAMANYEALLYAENRKPSAHALNFWLAHFRDDLLAHPPDSTAINEEAGPLSLGYRLTSSRSPGGYDPVVYGKGSWVIHMLRMMLRDPLARDPDERFAAMLQNVLTAHRFHAISTLDFQHAAEKVMTHQMDVDGSGSLDWFFDEWVRQTGIPHYRAEFRVIPHGKAYLVRGILHQEDVPAEFTAIVPLFAAGPGEKSMLLGAVTAFNAETKFQFVSTFPPRRIVIDPQHTLLHRPD